MNGSDNTPTINEGDTVLVNDLDHFVTILTDWHANKVNLLQHMLQIPPGSEMTTEAGTVVVMQGEFLDGFKAGLSLALMELGSLPFTTETESSAPDDSTKH